METPNPGGPHVPNLLSAVQAVSPTDVWAVGHDGVVGSTSEGFILHWDGSSWTRATSPDLGGGSELTGVSAVAADDVWVVGSRLDGTTQETALEHFDGSTWTTVSDGGRHGYLSGVSMITSHDVWAVGRRGGTDLIEHWDGARWTRTPGVGLPGYYLNGVDAASPNDVWAVGYFRAGHEIYPALAEHWDGTSWTQVTTANPCTYNEDGFQSVTTVSATDAWAVGPCAQVEHWDGTSWQVVTSAQPPTLHAISALSPTNVWAAGESYGPWSEMRTFTEQWDGTAWTQARSANPGGRTSNQLTAVDARSANDVWAVGFNTVFGTTVIRHWDGTRWKQDASPSPGGQSRVDELDGVSADSATDAWAVGAAWSNRAEAPALIEHWDGSSWTTVPNPKVCDSLYPYPCLNSVSALSPTDVWAVGDEVPAGDGFAALIEHWDGTAWTEVPNVTVAAGTTALNGVDAITATDVWAVGTITLIPGTTRTFIEHWDGTSWKRVRSPNQRAGAGSNALFGVGGTSATDIWAVGFSVMGPLVEHYDGSGWSRAAKAQGGEGFGLDLRGVSAVSTNDAWAVGEGENAARSEVGLIEHWDGTAWTVQTSPSPGTSSLLSGVSAVSASSAFAVGRFFPAGERISNALTEKWDGTSWRLF